MGINKEQESSHYLEPQLSTVCARRKAKIEIRRDKERAAKMDKSNYPLTIHSSLPDHPSAQRRRSKRWAGSPQCSHEQISSCALQCVVDDNKMRPSWATDEHVHLSGRLASSESPACHFHQWSAAHSPVGSCGFRESVEYIINWGTKNSPSRKFARQAHTITAEHNQILLLCFHCIPSHTQIKTLFIPSIRRQANPLAPRQRCACRKSLA